MGFLFLRFISDLFISFFMLCFFILFFWNLIYYKILACEDASDPATVNRLVNGKRSKDSEEYEDYTITEANRPKEADPGSKIYVAYVEWGFSVPDDDDYTEDEVLYVYFHNGRWYVDGKPL